MPEVRRGALPDGLFGAELERQIAETADAVRARLATIPALAPPSLAFVLGSGLGGVEERELDRPGRRGLGAHGQGLDGVARGMGLEVEEQQGPPGAGVGGGRGGPQGARMGGAVHEPQLEAEAGRAASPGRSRTRSASAETSSTIGGSTRLASASRTGGRPSPCEGLAAMAQRAAR